MKRKILFISPQPFFTERGSPLRVYCTLQAFSSLGYEVDLLAFPIGEEKILPGMRIFRSFSPFRDTEVPIGASWKKVFLDGFLSMKALRLIIQNRYAAIHGVEEAAFIAQVLAKFHSVPYVADMHSLLSEQLAQAKFIRSPLFHRQFQKRYESCLRGSGGIMTVADELSSFARNIAPQKSVVTIEDLPLESIGEADQELVKSIRKRYVPDNRKVVVYTGNFKAYQGVDLLIEAFSLAQKKLLRGRAVLLLVGAGTPQETEYCQNLVAQHNLQDSVLFTGNRPTGEMAAFLSVADVLVSPRVLGGNTPLKIYSYMAASKLIVATRISSHTQVLDDQSAFLVEPNAEAFAEVLCRSTFPEGEDRERFQSCIANAKRLTETRFTKAMFSQKLGLLYEKVLC